MSDVTVDIDGQEVELSSQDKVFFPDIGFTKGDLVAYYREVSEVLLPHLCERPLSLERYPDGVDSDGFYQKKASDYFPAWLDTVSVMVRERDEEQPQVVCNSEAALAYLVNQGVVTFHPWLSRADRLDHPDKLVFDLDPAEDGFEQVIRTARVIKEVLDEIGMRAYVMTSGSKGLHVTVHLDRGAPFDDVRDLARDLAEVVAARDPEHLTTKMAKDERKGKLFVDYLRNAYGQTSVAPYVVRALPAGPVATPLEWDELDDPNLDPQGWTVQNLAERLEEHGDPWCSFYDKAFSAAEAAEKLAELED